MLVSDYIHPTPHGGRCRIRIYEPAKGLPVVVCSTELRGNEGTSVTNSAEQILNVTAIVWSKAEGGRFRPIPQNSLFDDDIYVSATSWELFTDFVAHRWSVLVPIFLTILTAIIIPFVILPWWKRRNQPSATRDRSRGSSRDDGWI